MDKVSVNQKNSKNCISCLSKISEGAKKCPHCGAWQDYRRYLHVGTVTIAIITAFATMLVVSVDGFEKLRAFFANEEGVSLTAKLLEINPLRVSLLVDNDGQGAALSDGSLMCSVLVPKHSEALMIPAPREPDRFMGYRRMTWSDVVARYIYFFGDGKQEFLINGRSFKTITSAYRSLVIEEVNINSNKSNFPESYCFFRYVAENGESGFAWDILDEMEVSTFSLDSPDVAVAFRNRKDRLNEVIPENLQPSAK